MTSSSALLYTLTLIPGIGNKTLRELLTFFGSVENLWEADASSLSQISGIGSKTLSAILHTRETLDPEKEWRKILDQGIQIVTFLDDTYPSLLKEIPDAPMVLFVRGHTHWNTQNLIAIVGSRKCSSYGRQVTEHLASQLASAGFTIVSGLAFGIDSIAHKAVLETQSETIAVLAGGIDDASIAPQTHLSLAHNIIQQGALISEYAPGTTPTVGTFPARNRIVAGMCLGTLVIEAPEKSGSLITARLALDYNREVFAVPGSIFSPLSIGTHHLIKSGAKIVTSLQDILEELPLLKKESLLHQASPFTENTYSEEEKIILALLSHEPLHVDKIAKAVRLETSSLNATLGLLEIKGIIQNIGGMQYIRK